MSYSILVVYVDRKQEVYLLDVSSSVSTSVGKQVCCINVIVYVQHAL